jgi:hypothetical protein
MSMPSSRQRAVDGREVLGEKFRRLVGHVEEDAIEAVALHFEVDGTGDDVARREFGAFVVKPA